VKTVGVVTCRPLPEPDPDEELLLSALQAAGVSVSLLPWNDEQADPGHFDLCVLRSCWDYHLDPHRFLAWVTRAAGRTRLFNSLDIVRWNLHKGYLRQLQAARVPVVPTAWVEAGDRAELTRLMAEHGWDDVVVKPAIGAGSHMTRRIGAAEAAGVGQEFLDALSARGDAMVQPFMPSVVDRGERAIVWIDGEFTHQVVKRPRYHGQDEQVSAASWPCESDLQVAERAVGVVRDDLLYARVDLIDGADGEPVVSELELLEPSLFLLQHRPALERLVAALVRHA